jgi:hypothetical protein
LDLRKGATGDESHRRRIKRSTVGIRLPDNLIFWLKSHNYSISLVTEELLEQFRRDKLLSRRSEVYRTKNYGAEGFVSFDPDERLNVNGLPMTKEEAYMKGIIDQYGVRFDSGGRI